MSIISIIPARGGSKGIPRKNLLPLCGTPLLIWTIKAACSAKALDGVFVSTDDSEIATLAKQAGAGVIWRPAEISCDSASSESALLHGIETLMTTESGIDSAPPHSDSASVGTNTSRPSSPILNPSSKDDILVFLQCTSPLTTGDDIDALVDKLVQEEADSAFSVVEFDYFVWREANGQAEGINHDKTFRPRRQDREPQYVENGAIYAMLIGGFLEAKHRFFGKTVFHVMPRERCWEIDEPVDFEIAENLLRKQIQQNKRSLLPASIEAVVFDFDGVLTDNRVIQSQDGTEAVSCNRSDGMGIRHLIEAGIPVLILSSEENTVVRARAAKLKVEIIHGSLEKGHQLVQWALENKIDLKNTVYVGNDVNDIPPMLLVGCPVAVADAHLDIKSHACFILERKGGDGAAREVSDLILDERSNQRSEIRGQNSENRNQRSEVRKQT